MWVKNNLTFVEDINVGKAVHENGVADKIFKDGVFVTKLK